MSHSGKIEGGRQSEMCSRAKSDQVARWYLSEWQHATFLDGEIEMNGQEGQTEAFKAIDAS